MLLTAGTPVMATGGFGTPCINNCILLYYYYIIADTDLPGWLATSLSGLTGKAEYDYECLRCQFSAMCILRIDNKFVIGGGGHMN